MISLRTDHVVIPSDHVVILTPSVARTKNLAVYLFRFSRGTSRALRFSLLLLLALPVIAQQQPPTPDATAPTYTLHVSSDIVLTNVVVRDKSGSVVRGLQQSDFTIFENGKPQRITSFDFESVDQAATLNEATVSGHTGVLAKNGIIDPAALRNHRLIIFFFDLTSMQVEDVDRSVQSAKDYINKKMQPADLVAVVSLGTSLALDQDFTADKQTLLHTIGRYNGSEGQGFANGEDSTTTVSSEDSSAYQPDESEYNDINTDRKLYAIAEVAKSLSKIDEKKSMLYFSGGLTRTGIENQASLRAAVNAAVKANLAIYALDTRGLEALPPVGSAQSGSLRGTSAYSAAAMQSQLDSNFSSQETLTTLAADTGGKAFLDSNDFSPAFAQIQRDTSAYYILGFRSENTTRDGRFRKLTVKLNRPGLKLEYRPGYYAQADYKHANNEDREHQLEQELASDLPATDVAIYLQALYFRTDSKGENAQFFVPVSIVIPGSQIPFIQGGNRDKATLDIIGVVKDSTGRAIGNVRDTVKLAVDQSQQVAQKNVQYSTGFTLPVGRYHLKFVVRENQTGRMGSFEADITVPDLKKSPLKLSSVVLSSQRAPNTKKSDNPLVRDGQELIPNVAHAFRSDQHLYLLYEVYDPARATAAKPDATKPAPKSSQPAKGSAAAVRVLTSIQFFSNGSKVYETPLVEATAINLPARNAVAFNLDVPLSALKPGLYTCQITVVDDAAGTFTFPRLALVIRDAKKNAPAIESK